MAKPTQGTVVLAHALVGAAVAYIAWKAFGAGAIATVAASLLAVYAHAKFDAPVARALA